MLFERGNKRNYSKKLVYYDKILSVIVFFSIAFFNPDFLVISTYFLIIPYLFLTKRKNALKHFFIASIISIVWILIANNQYGYNQKVIYLFGLNTFPLFAWAIGLFAIYMIYAHWEHTLKAKKFYSKIFLFTLFYLPLLISAETIGYYLFNIKNLATSIYSGLPICNCIHAPNWMQAAYLLLGPIYFSICYLLKLENPHLNKKSLNL